MRRTISSAEGGRDSDDGEFLGVEEDSLEQPTTFTAKSASPGLKIRLVLVVCFLSVCLGTALYLGKERVSSIISSSMSSTMSMSVDYKINAQENEELKKFAGIKLNALHEGKQPVKSGCVNIYGSNPNQDWEDTRKDSPTYGQMVPPPSFTVCDDTMVHGQVLQDLGFDTKDSKVFFPSRSTIILLFLSLSTNFPSLPFPSFPFLSLDFLHVSSFHSFPLSFLFP